MSNVRKGLTLDVRVEVEQNIGKKVHKFIILRFLVKMWCTTYLCVVLNPIY